MTLKQEDSKSNADQEKTGSHDPVYFFYKLQKGRYQVVRIPISGKMES